MVWDQGEAGEGDALTPQATQDLMDKCRQYCDDPDPLCLLNIGELTITKIKDAFAVLKSLVLEARQGQGGEGSGSRWGEDGKREVSASDEEVRKQIADLKSCLLQRDNEIAILVNMVKKERAGAAAGGERGGIAEDPYQQQREEETAVKASYAGRGGRGGGGGGGGAPNPQTNPGIMSAAEREALRSEKIIKKHLYGVPPPEDKTLFDDMQGATLQCFCCACVDWSPLGLICLCCPSVFRVFPCELRVEEFHRGEQKHPEGQDERGAAAR